MSLLMLGMVSALVMPHPIYGNIKASGNPVLNADIIINNLNTGVSSETTTNDKGFYQVDLGNVDPNYRDGDIIKVSLAYCIDVPYCSKTTTVSGGGNQISFDVITENLPQLPQEPNDVIVITYVCWNGQGVASMADCPIQQPIVQITCLDGSIVDSKDLCPEADNSWISWVIGIFIALVAGAGGWKIYNGKFKHYHKEVTGYHDPNTRHSNPKYRHTAWKDNPLKCISEVRKIQQGIDLSAI